MSYFEFSLKNSGFSWREIEKTGKKVFPYIKEIQKKLEKNHYQFPEEFINLPFDEDLIEKIEKMGEKYQALNPGLIVIIGIGGSNLGTMALWYTLAPEKDVLFAETVDPTYLAQIFKKMEEVYSQGKNILVFLVSKSGTTIESVANFGAIIGRLKRLYKDWQNYVVAITDPGTPLFEYAKKNKIDSISIPPSIGGRYSVLTPVGLLPAKVFGLNIRDIMVGARSVVKDSLSLNMKKNYALQNAATVFLNLKAKKTIYNLFIFSPRLKYVGQWWRQIIAESLGKDGKGITPIVSLGTTDLHSVTQLYLDGPKDKFTTFVSVKDFGRDFKISGEIELFRLAKGLEGRTIEEVMSIIFQAVEKSYKKQKLPYTECILNSISEESLGAFFQLKMIEAAFLGYLLKVNPYNEPAVDIYKAEMRKILSKEN